MPISFVVEVNHIPAYHGPNRRHIAVNRKPAAAPRSDPDIEFVEIGGRFGRLNQIPSQMSKGGQKLVNLVIMRSRRPRLGESTVGG
jgi:hypothetical protein